MSIFVNTVDISSGKFLQLRCQVKSGNTVSIIVPYGFFLEMITTKVGDGSRHAAIVAEHYPKPETFHMDTRVTIRPRTVMFSNRNGGLGVSLQIDCGFDIEIRIDVEDEGTIFSSEILYLGHERGHLDKIQTSTRTERPMTFFLKETPFSNEPEGGSWLDVIHTEERPHFGLSECKNLGSCKEALEFARTSLTFRILALFGMTF